LVESSVLTDSTRIDTLDRQIISQLQQDGRRAFSGIARQLEISEGTVRQRYRRLVRSGVLQIVGVADPFKTGFRCMAMIGLNVAIDGERSIDDVAEEVALFPEVSYVVLSTGDFDLLVEVIMENNDELAGFLQEKLHRVKGITRTETFILLHVYKMNFGGWRSLEVPSPGIKGRLRERRITGKS
jgi:Lrp/AsnC family transcriptional regulator, regulator for asnA, asnC and gidA